ncbi:MAG: fatty acid desaturase family protein [Fimbriiglobus sp.]
MESLKFEREPAGSFYRVTRARVDEYFRTTGRSRRAGGLLTFKAVLLVSLMVSSYAAIVTQVAGPWSLLPLGLIFGFGSLLLAINIGHDASHQVVFQNPVWNHALQRLCFVFIGVDGYLWRLRHIKSHHLFPNVNGSDTDIDENPFVRLSPNQPWRWHFQLQHIYAPFVYLFAAFYTTIWGDFVYLSKRELANMTDIRHPWYEYLLFAICKITYFTVTLAIPLVVLDLPWWVVLLGFFVVNGCTSLLFVVLLIGTHFADLADFPVPDANGSVGRSWAEHNLATACDWSPHSFTAHFISGGSNAHASHHLFPRVCHTHYPAIARIIETTAQEFGIRYNAVTLWGMIQSHFRLLHQLGKRPG